MLEPCAGRLARTVLRGGGRGNTVPLPGDYPRCRRALRKRGIVPRIARRGVESRERLGRYRWVVERTLSWLNRFRRLNVRYEHRADIHEAFLTLGCALVCWNVLKVASSKGDTATSNLQGAPLSSLSPQVRLASRRSRGSVRPCDRP